MRQVSSDPHHDNPLLGRRTWGINKVLAHTHMKGVGKLRIEK